MRTIAFFLLCACWWAAQPPPRLPVHWLSPASTPRISEMLWCWRSLGKIISSCSSKWKRVANQLRKKGYYTTDTSYYWETNLYNANNEDLIYSAQTEFFDPASAKSLAAQYSKEIVKDMLQKNVVARRK